MIPDKYNELIGLQHCKLFVFDDSVIISGANLSTDYFTNRQDRYILIGNYYIILCIYILLCINVTLLFFRKL